VSDIDWPLGPERWVVPNCSTGEYPDTASMAGVIKAIDHLRDTALQALEEVRRENVALRAKLDAALMDRDTWRAKAVPF
jgi:hypothetical protein